MHQINNLKQLIMKKIILSAVLIMTIGFANAQSKIEAKLNPLGALFGRPELNGEYIVTDHFGVELSLSTAFGKFGSSIGGSEKPTQSGFGVKVAGKYYFSPDKGGDGWYGGVYVRQESLTLKYSEAQYAISNYKSSIFAGGVEFGKKWVFDSGLLIELGAGVGRPFSEKREFTNSTSVYDNASFEIGVDFTGKFAVGYRF